MNIYQFQLTCDVCGGPVWGTIRDAGRAWDTRWMLSHRDPRICRDYLDRERHKIEEERRQWLLSLKPMTVMDVQAEQLKLLNLQNRIEQQRREVLEWARL